MNFSEKTAVVTGGSRGLGRADLSGAGPGRSQRGVLLRGQRSGGQ